MKAEAVPTGMLIKQKRIRIEYLRKLDEGPFEETPQFNWRVVKAMRGALQRLSHTEREVVERFHYCGQSCDQIGALLKIPEFRVYAILNEARRKLKWILGSFAQKRYGIAIKNEPCRVCLSEKREAIEKLLKTKTKEETWKRILRKLKTGFLIRTNARSLIRHLKQHQKPARRKSGGSTP